MINEPTITEPENPLYIVDDSIGYLITAYRFRQGTHKLAEEKQILFLGDDWSDIQTKVFARFFLEKGWFINITQINRGMLKDLVKKAGWRSRETNEGNNGNNP